MLKNKAIKLLSMREHSYLELLNKLKKYTDDIEEIKCVLKELTQQGYLSEERYVQAYVNSRKNKYGMNKIRFNLKAKTHNEELIDTIIVNSEVDEYAIAQKLLEKKFLGKKASDKNELARRIRFLQNKGFSFDIINKVMKK